LGLAAVGARSSHVARPMGTRVCCSRVSFRPLRSVLFQFYEYIKKLETEEIDPCPDSANEIFKSLSSKTELDNLESVKILSDLINYKIATIL
jgi:hypothetical protein